MTGEAEYTSTYIQHAQRPEASNTPGRARGVLWLPVHLFHHVHTMRLIFPILAYWHAETPFKDSTGKNGSSP